MELQTSFEYNQRYFKTGSLKHNGGQLWFVLHGYGQLASFFIKKFQWLEEYGHCIIAPEGLNRFYLQGFSGRVGAAWMTKEDRLRDINNYLNYLNSIYQLEVDTISTPKINLLGFSQGTATISRWLAQSSFKFHRIFLWAGMLAEDMDLRSSKHRFEDLEVYVIYGNKDEYITPQRIAKQDKMLQDLGVKPRRIIYSGGHTIEESVLREIISKEQPQGSPPPFKV